MGRKLYNRDGKNACCRESKNNQHTSDTVEKQTVRSREIKAYTPRDHWAKTIIEIIIIIIISQHDFIP